MNKFFVLLTKEVRELLTPQMLLPLLITIVLFVFIGQIAGREMKRAQQPQEAIVFDHDRGPLAQTLLAALQQSNFTIDLPTSGSPADIIGQSSSKKVVAIVDIPAGFSTGLQAGQPQTIGVYALLRNFSVTGAGATQRIQTAIEAVNSAVSGSLLATLKPGASPDDLKNPVKTTDYTVVGTRVAQVSPGVVIGIISQQTYFIPIILFIVIIFAAQMIALSIATEKENKTLDTLLAAPVSRQSIVAAKMIGAALVALLGAVTYMIGFRYYLGGLTGNALGGQVTPVVQEAIRALGLSFTPAGYVLLGASLFLGILCALAVALLLGVFTEDSKSVQGAISPLMVLVAIPYFLTLFLDFSTVSPALKTLVYAIPFSYPFLAGPSIFLRQTTPILWGLLYQTVFFLTFVYIASRVFSTDRIVTMKWNFRRRGFLARRSAS